MATRRRQPSLVLRYWARQLHHHPLRVLSLLTLGLLVTGGLVLWLVERAAQPGLSLWDALWLAAVSLTTSEPYGMGPTTGPGRIVQVIVAFMGITLAGSFVAAITALIIQSPEPEYEREEYTSVCGRLERIERRLVRMERELRARGAKPEKHEH